MQTTFTISLSPEMARRWQKCVVDMNKLEPEKHRTIESLLAEILANDIECQEQCCEYNLAHENIIPFPVDESIAMHN